MPTPPQVITPLRVFLVEDRHDVQVALEELLRASGPFETIATATTEAEAKLWLQEHPAQWELAVVDLILEEGGGFGVVQRARALHRRGRIAVMSGYLSDGLKRHCVSLGADVVFEKGTPTEFQRWLGTWATWSGG